MALIQHDWCVPVGAVRRQTHTGSCLSVVGVTSLDRETPFKGTGEGHSFKGTYSTSSYKSKNAFVK